MKNVNLNVYEVNWLIRLLQERLVFFSSGIITNGRKHRDTLLAIDILSQKSDGFALELDLKRVIYSCINGRLSLLFKQIDDAIGNLGSLDSDMKHALKTIDMGLDMLTKFGYQRLKYHQKYDFSAHYRDRIPA